MMVLKKLLPRRKLYLKLTRLDLLKPNYWGVNQSTFPNLNKKVKRLKKMMSENAACNLVLDQEGSFLVVAMWPLPCWTVERLENEDDIDKAS